MAERQATYYKLQLDEKHCPIDGHGATHSIEGGIEPHRMRDLFRVMMFLGYSQTLDKPIDDEYEALYLQYEEREFVNLHIENGVANLVMHLSGSFCRVEGHVEDGKLVWRGPECPDDWREELDLVDEDRDHPATRLAEALDELADGVKAVTKELVNDER